MATVSFTGCTLTGLQYLPAWSATVPPYTVMGTPVAAQADIAALDTAILDDINVARAIPPNYGPTTGLGRGILYVPNRGFLQIRPGDYVAFDPATGFPILISGRAAAGGGWTHG
jgi:hypothetical protein